MRLRVAALIASRRVRKLNLSVHLLPHASSSPTTFTRSSTSNLACSLHGTLLNFNTIEAFRHADKQALFQHRADEVRLLRFDQLPG